MKIHVRKLTPGWLLTERNYPARGVCASFVCRKPRGANPSRDELRSPIVEGCKYFHLMQLATFNW